QLERGMPNWWFLRLDDVDTNRPLTLGVVARDVSTPSEGDAEGKTNPLNPAWTLPTRAVMSADGSNWIQTPAGERHPREASYRVQPTTRTLWLAWGPPFTPHDAQALADRLARVHAFVQPFILAKSREGRDVPGVRIADG